MHRSPYIAISIATCNKSNIRTISKEISTGEKPRGRPNNIFTQNSYEMTKNHNEEHVHRLFRTLARGKPNGTAMLWFLMHEQFHQVVYCLFFGRFNSEWPRRQRTTSMKLSMSRVNKFVVSQWLTSLQTNLV